MKTKTRKSTSLNSNFEVSKLLKIKWNAKKEIPYLLGSKIQSTSEKYFSLLDRSKFLFNFGKGYCDMHVPVKKLRKTNWLFKI